MIRFIFLTVRFLYISVCFLFLSSHFAAAIYPDKAFFVEDPDPLRFNEEISAFLKWDQKNSFPPDAILFVGSSSIRFWHTHDAFPDYPLINRGFGGAHISDVLYYYDQLVKKYHPRIIIFYAGDNDVAAGKTAEQVANDLIKFYTLLQKDLPATRVVFLTIKPSLSRWTFWNEMQKTNELIKKYAEDNVNLTVVDVATALLGKDGTPDPDLFLSDALHLNQAGYERWEKIVAPILNELYSQSIDK